MAKNDSIPEPPSPLGESGRLYWDRVLTEFEIEDYRRDLLAAACIQLDRAASAAAVVATEGVTSVDRFGQKKTHPAIEIERQAHLAFCKLQRELSLDIEPPSAPRGPMRPGSLK